MWHRALSCVRGGPAVECGLLRDTAHDRILLVPWSNDLDRRSRPASDCRPTSLRTRLLRPLRVARVARGRGPWRGAHGAPARRGASAAPGRWPGVEACRTTVLRHQVRYPRVMARVRLRCGPRPASADALLAQAGEGEGHWGEFAAVAFHKAADRPRTTDWAYADWAALAAFTPDIPDRPDEPDRIEVDVTRQILTLVEDGQVDRHHPGEHRQRPGLRHLHRRGGLLPHPAGRLPPDPPRPRLAVLLHRVHLLPLVLHPPLRHPRLPQRAPVAGLPRLRPGPGVGVRLAGEPPGRRHGRCTSGTDGRRSADLSRRRAARVAAGETVEAGHLPRRGACPR